jgi:hypothetical protein
VADHTHVTWLYGAAVPEPDAGKTRKAALREEETAP